jgi:hypothetical protein
VQPVESGAGCHTAVTGPPVACLSGVVCQPAAWCNLDGDLRKHDLRLVVWRRPGMQLRHGWWLPVPSFLWLHCSVHRV